MRRFPLVVLLLALASTASGQEVTVTQGDEPTLATSEPTFLEGGGVRLSDGLYFHPNAQVSTAYQTNVFYNDPADVGGVVGAPLLLIGVGGSLQTQAARNPAENGGAAPRLALKGLLDLTWHQYLSDDQYTKLQSDLGIGALVDARFNPEGELTFNTKAGYTRAVRPPPAYTAADVVRDKVELGLGATFKPGGGAIQATASYTFGLDLFEPALAAAYGDRLSNTFAIGAKWQWLPRTQYNFETSFGILSPGSPVKASSMPLRINLGVATLITPPFGVVLRAGFGNNFGGNAQYMSYLALAEARYALGPTLRFAGGYSHDFQDALIGDFYSDHALYVRTSMAFGGRVQVRAKADARLRTWEGITDIPGVADFSSPTRYDLIIRVEANGDYQLKPWLLVGAGWILESDITDFSVAPAAGVANRAAYNWNEIRVNVTAKF